MHKRGADGTDSKAERNDWNEPSRSDPFTSYIRRDLEDNIGDIEDRKHGVVVVAFGVHAEVNFEG
jgi:hypothetical protein